MENFFMNWILPILFFFVLGQMIMHFMGNRFGGNAMSFGKSNAKIYIQAQTGVTFKDVAGQDEAKEALVELVDFSARSARSIKRLAPPCRKAHSYW
jgi:cell division protease FtsH